MLSQIIEITEELKLNRKEVNSRPMLKKRERNNISLSLIILN